MNRVVTVGIALATIAITPAVARGNGDTAHAWITAEAVGRLPDGELKRLLSRPELRDALINGSAFPDGGYIVKNDYGEMAHWEPFHDAYIQWIRTHYPLPLTRGDAALHVAFLMGVASHGLADQTFDACFAPAARVHDAAGWSDALLQDHDSNTDLILAAQTGARFDDITPWVPADDLSALYLEAFDYSIAPDVLAGNQELLCGLTLSYAAKTDERTRMDAAVRYPWSAENLLDPTEPGAPPDQASIVADYLVAVWDRLHGVRDPQNLVIATHPRAGGGGLLLDHTRVESQAVIVLGHGFETARFAGRIRVTDGGGAPIEVDIASPWNTSITNLLRILPRQDWPADADITVTIDPAAGSGAPLESVDGLAMPAAWSFTFSTRAGDAAPPSSDPTPHVGEPATGNDDRGGCAAAHGHGSIAIALALAALSWRRRRAS